MTKIFVAIDGSNFYRKLRDLGFKHLSDFNYNKFLSWLSKKTKISACCFYVGLVREEVGNDKSRELKSGQDRFLANLQKQKIPVKTGYILKSDGTYYEKGVDVQIAVDVCMKAVRNEYDKLILVSSDTDLIPAIKEVQKMKKEVEYVGFDKSPSFALIRFSNSRTLLKKDDLMPFVPK